MRVTPVRKRSWQGLTVIEVLVASTVFLIVLGALGGLLTSASRAYRVTGERSEFLQDAEAVLQLLRYEIGRAGFRGVDDTAFDRVLTGCAPMITVDRPLGFGSNCHTVRVERRSDAGSGIQDTITVQFFETEFLPPGDTTGERRVSYTVNEADRALERTAGAEGSELLVGNVRRLVVLDLVDRTRDPYPVTTLLALPEVSGSSGERVWPTNFVELAGMNVRVTFVDGTESDFLIGFHNPQLFAVED